MKAAAIYARVSSEQQKEENTIASQTAALVDFARGQGYSVPDDWVIEDEGFSGASLLRPGLERLRDLAAEGYIQAVLIHSPDRLSRKYAYQVLLTEEFARHGVETIFLKAPHSGTPEDQLMLQFQGMIAEYERAQILERSRRGKRHRAKAGEVSVLGGAPYGYRYIRKTSGHRHATRPMPLKPRSCGWSTTSIRWAAGVSARLPGCSAGWGSPPVGGFAGNDRSSGRSCATRPIRERPALTRRRPARGKR
jgi:DNA invertase Pin-like site-specific DNA recombinase